MAGEKKGKFVILNYKGPTDPEAGGAETYCLDIAHNAVKDDYEVLWVSRKHPGSGPLMKDEKIKMVYVGGKYSYYLWNLFTVLGSKPKVLLVSINAIPFLDRFIRTDHKVVHIHHIMPTEVLKQKLRILFPIAFFLQNIALKFLYRNSRVSTNGHHVRDELRGLGLRDVTQVKTVVLPDRTVKKIKKKTVLGPGSLRPWKRPEHIITAFAKSEIDAKLILFGRAENSELVDQLRDLSIRLGVNEKIEILQNISEADKNKLYNEASVCIVASMKEGVGLVSLEPQAYGCPVVGYDVSGINENIVSGTNGLLVKDGDVESLSRALKNVYEDQTLWEQMSIASLEHNASYGSESAYEEFKKKFLLEKESIPSQ